MCKRCSANFIYNGDQQANLLDFLTALAKFASNRHPESSVCPVLYMNVFCLKYFSVKCSANSVFIDNGELKYCNLLFLSGTITGLGQIVHSGKQEHELR